MFNKGRLFFISEGRRLMEERARTKVKTRGNCCIWKGWGWGVAWRWDTKAPHAPVMSPPFSA